VKLVVKYCLSVSFFIVGGRSLAQFSVSGTVKDQENNALIGATIQLSGQRTFTDQEGKFSISGIPHAKQELQISYIGFKNYTKTIELHYAQTLEIVLQKDEKQIEKLNISVHTKKDLTNKTSFSDKEIQQNFSGSLAGSLESISGINAINIGSGMAKPIIRGLGFNRIAVVVNTNKYEGQQWGADHGLEIDSFSPENIEIIKGTTTIQYGSDAIAGVLNIQNNKIPDKKSFYGTSTFLARSVNQTIGTSFSIANRNDNFFYKIKASYIDYGDFKTTTDTIIYLTYKIPIHNRKLKNTAGQEWNVFSQIGYVKNNYHTIFSISNNKSKAGFFPGSHGIPDLKRLQDDNNSRNIDYPYQQANHFTIQNQHKWTFSKAELFVDLDFQNNHRQEKSEFHTHYFNQLPPEKDADLELDFNLNTFSANSKYTCFFTEKHKTNFGFQLQTQQNNVKGYNFLLPKYDRETGGIYALHQYNFSGKLHFDFGFRYDFSQTKLYKFYDEILYDYLIERNYPQDLAEQYALRSPELSKNFNNFNAKAGISYSLYNQIDFTLNLGSSFRTPTAIELGANGVHHGSFRHEKGDANLDSEKGYVVDFQVEHKTEKFNLKFSPYLYYFDNYIYLRPTGVFSILPHSGQIYQFSQTKALLSGFEFETDYTFGDFRSEIVLEYIYNRRIKDKFPLPFTPPLNVFAKINYTILTQSKYIENLDVYINGKYFAEQKNIAQMEEITPSSSVFGLGFSADFSFGKIKPNLMFSAQNIFDTKYYSHTSFYRTLEIPEQGRNIQLMLKIQF